MRLPPDWSAERASGWWELHHLKHEPCGWRSSCVYDLWGEGDGGERDVRRIVYGHECKTGGA